MFEKNKRFLVAKWSLCRNQNQSISMGMELGCAEEASQVVSPIMGEIVPCPLVSHASDLRCQTTTDNVKGRAAKKAMIAVVKGAPACSALRRVTVVKAMEILTTRKMPSEELGNQSSLMAGVGGCP